jgi:hypothetical protein
LKGLWRRDSFGPRSSGWKRAATACRQDRLVYEFNLEERIPPDHLLRRIDAALDLSWLRADLAPFYSHTDVSQSIPS